MLAYLGALESVPFLGDALPVVFAAEGRVLEPKSW
jgi:hypothetical protein